MVTTLKELEKERQKAKEANEAKSKFLANMSHEIRTPMNGILGFVDILERDEKDPKRRELFEHIKNSGSSLLTIINDILDILKIESGKLKLEEAKFATADLFDSVAALYQEICNGKNIHFIYEPHTLPSHFVGDIVRIKQVLFNLLSNAVKFTQEQGKIRLFVSYEGDELHCSVQDSGVGIKKENLEKIFQDFEQEDSTITRRYGGTGLGLAISSNLIMMMGSRLEVASEVGRGSTFSFTIKLKSVDEVVQKSDSSEDTILRTFENCYALIVEDNKTNQMLLEMFLDDFGLESDIANDGVEAVAMAEKKVYDIILMDENMPNMNGIEASTKIKAMPKNAAVPIVAVTANALTGDRERFLEAGMDDYMSKPYGEEDVCKILNRYCQ